jgi:hypothetical protein
LRPGILGYSTAAFAIRREAKEGPMQAELSLAGDGIALRGIRATPRRASRTYARKRVCAAAGCSTQLSVYNASRLCWQHEPSHPFILRIERKDKRN